MESVWHGSEDLRGLSFPQEPKQIVVGRWIAHSSLPEFTTSCLGYDFLQARDDSGRAFRMLRSMSTARVPHEPDRRICQDAAVDRPINLA